MPNRSISPNSLIARITTLRRRHRDISRRIESEELRPLPDPTHIKQLKQERLGLKDAIRMTKSMLMRAGVHPPYTTQPGRNEVSP
ncbi:MAG: YdcH family protein [Rhodobacteraceae bacterium]|jgi:hypothetical protein|nr:YdcH family protein [Paracoccaceae bacterium]